MISMKYKVVQDARKYTYRKRKGYLLLEIVVGFAIVSIMLVCVWSSYLTAINLNKKAIEKQKNYIILEALEKEFSRNISYQDVLELAGEKNIKVKSEKVARILNTEIIEEKLGSLEDFYISFTNFENERVNIKIYKDEYEVEVDKLRWIEVR